MAKVNPVQIQKDLKGIDYPVSKQDLVKHAQKNGADENVCATLEKLPDREYETPTEVSKAIGQME
ncbi:DUF2795 domain-containing protein [Floridanema evergladense]|uniref:DUF2795 domain-containing protein n=1 Tax=Floridaenema evergladense BLCC-F167 TaxID=3153639 RepID=A0ABV4WKE4_9CYAN